MRHIFIVNPNAGKILKEKLIHQIEEVFKATDYRIILTKCEKDASAIAKRYASLGMEIRIYACGGDGTLNEVVNGMYEYENAYLGIIPIGTGNDFIKSLRGYRKEDFLQIDNYQNPTVKTCDVLDIDGYICLNTTSLGFDVEVAKNVSKFKRLPLSKDIVPYYLSLGNSLLSSLNHTYNVILDGKAIGKENYTFVVACNGNYYGGGFCPCPDAQLDDGYIDVCLIKKVSRLKIIRLANAYKKGKHVKYTDIVEMRQVKKMQVLCDDILTMNVDGEIITKVNPSIQILPHKIKLILPNLE